MAPNVSRVSLIFNPDNPTTCFFKQEFESAAPALAVDPIVAHIHGLGDVERAIEERAASPEWRPSVRAGCHGDRTARAHRRACGAQLAACDLFGPRFW